MQQPQSPVLLLVAPGRIHTHTHTSQQNGSCFKQRDCIFGKCAIGPPSVFALTLGVTAICLSDRLSASTWPEATWPMSPWGTFQPWPVMPVCSVPKGQQLSLSAQQELTWCSCWKEPLSLRLSGLIFCLNPQLGFAFC